MSGTMNRKIEAVLESSGAAGCVEWGKCVAVCPMPEMYPDFSWEMSPRGVIRRALMGEDLLVDPAIWRCTGCNAGTDVCPESVSCRDLIRGLRELAVESGAAAPSRKCEICGSAFLPGPVEGYVRERLGDGTVDGYLGTCPACRRRRYALRNA